MVGLAGSATPAGSCVVESSWRRFRGMAYYSYGPGRQVGVDFHPKQSGRSMNQLNPSSFCEQMHWKYWGGKKGWLTARLMLGTIEFDIYILATSGLNPHPACKRPGPVWVDLPRVSAWQLPLCCSISVGVTFQGGQRTFGARALSARTRPKVLHHGSDALSNHAWVGGFNASAISRLTARDSESTTSATVRASQHAYFPPSLASSDWAEARRFSS